MLLSWTVNGKHPPIREGRRFDLHARKKCRLRQYEPHRTSDPRGDSAHPSPSERGVGTHSACTRPSGSKSRMRWIRAMLASISAMRTCARACASPLVRIAHSHGQIAVGGIRMIAPEIAIETRCALDRTCRTLIESNLAAEHAGRHQTIEMAVRVLEHRGIDRDVLAQASPRPRQAKALDRGRGVARRV